MDRGENQGNVRRLTREEEVELKEYSVRRIRGFLIALEVWQKESLRVC